MFQTSSLLIAKKLNACLLFRAATSGVFIAAGNASSSCLRLMTLDTQMTLALLQKLLMALRANDADVNKSCLSLSLSREMIGNCGQTL